MKKIRFFFEETKEIRLEKTKIRKVLDKIFTENNIEYDHINIVFCNDSYLLHLNIKFLKHNYYTDIITFENAIGNKVSGELYISLERVFENAILYRVKKKKELLRVIIHGILHMVKFNDKNVSDKRKMQEKENFYIQLFENN